MKAIIFNEFSNSYDVLKEVSTNKPSINEDEILIEQKAVAIDPYDIKYRSGAFGTDVILPFIGGSTSAGIVAEIGSNVTNFKIGDRVIAVPRMGAYAEFVVSKANETGVIPENVSFQQAAAVALGGQTGYSSIVDGIKLQAGENILIHGAAGSVGNVALQTAIAIEANKIYATSLPNDLKFVESFGENIQTIDFTSTDFTQVAKQVDAVLDVIGGDNLMKSLTVLKKGGRIYSTVPLPGGALEQADKLGVKATRFFMNSSGETLSELMKLISNNKLKIEIGKEATFNLENLIEGQKIVTEQSMRGKYILNF
ncbi:MAG: NADP-dependent oxidoreductase [Lactobacillaceae bacterium]|jgi:NADPH:quinone reductase-like Zn-dependent oxidoreductase|nr:NADP-dependent oxidoreductase [Lactobacillaceae bacterium]